MGFRSSKSAQTAMLTMLRFAMLTSKPPFQSSTTDEIYRRARDRDYEWPSPETSQKYISQEAKDLVATMLQDADRRPDPDTIVEHPFFTSGYMPVASDITSKLRDTAPLSSAFYEPLSDPEMVALNYCNVQEMCRECGVGPWCQSKLVFKNIWREMAEEEQNGLTPIIPLAEGIVYRPFDEIRNEQRLKARLAQQQAQEAREVRKAQEAQLTQQPSQALDRTAELSSFNQSTQAHRAPASLLRAPPQSFAAQQRAQGRPVNPAPTYRSQGIPESSLKTTGSLRVRSTREVAAAAPEPSDELAPLTKGTRSLRSNFTVKRSQTAPSVRDSAPQRIPSTTASSKQRVQEEKLSLFSPSEYQETVAGTQPDAVLDRLYKLQAELERALNSRSMAILSSRDKTPAPPHIVVKWVDYTNKFGLGYILNDGSVGCILRTIPTQEGTTSGLLPPACMLVHGAERHCQRRDDLSYPDRHQIVPMTEGVQFYENNGEEGFSRVRVAPESFHIPVYSDGSTGKLSAGKDIYDHRKRERIVLWKKFANYMIAYGREMDGQPPAEEAPIRVPTITDPTAAPSDIVTFYQRFGDVGCWMFCDGHMQVSSRDLRSLVCFLSNVLLQFNFPDHTKIVLDSTGTWCHFWHLPQDAAKHLEETGSLAEAALDGRTVLSYPLQTLLNFTAPPRQPAPRTGTRTASNPTRRRPEISPELQGIPGANHLRRKIEFIRDVIREWNANGGIGNSDMSREKRLRWCGMRETKNVPIPAKHVWVTIGARWGDERLSTYVDPRNPAELGEDIDETKKR